ncbi:5-aminolevulinate synthase, partial [Fulvimarina sp. 2208YS6-2-32]|nr:5-aminolevulinate synthase [Fulvimarina sp. 2208YS6-2-32]
PRGTERLRITPTPLHDDTLVEHLKIALVETWQTLGIAFASDRPDAEECSSEVTPLVVSKAGG